MSPINFSTVSSSLNFEIPPDAFSCPPPLKYLEANILTLKSPLDLNDIFINPSSFFSIKRTEHKISATLSPKLTKPSLSPFLKSLTFWSLSVIEV